MLLERASSREIVLVDGVKLVDPEGWTLVVPDTEGPATIVTAEADTAGQAGARAQEMADQIARIISETTN
jgi:phosphomannomutase